MVFQFMMSTIMMVVIITNFRQLDYMLKADLGFQKKQVVIVNTPRDVPNPFARRETFRNLLLDHPGVENVSYSYGMPGGHIPDSPTIEINGKQESVKGILVDDHYTDVLGIKIIEGRNFSQDHPGDVLLSSDHGEGGILISEGMAREFGLDSPIGKKIHSLGSQRFTLEIVGVFKDIHFRSLREKVEPLFLLRFADPGDGANIRIKTENIPSVLKVIQEDWEKIWPQTPFHYEFLDEAFNWQYRNEEQMADVIRYFTVLALIIACMGLFALSSFLVSRRTKEIGIRKSLGASVMTIYGMLSWNFIKWILLAIIIACPVGWYIMNKWLETFAYHIKLTWDIFGLAAIIAITIALLTITWQSVRTARANPVEALRYE